MILHTVLRIVPKRYKYCFSFKIEHVNKDVQQKSIWPKKLMSLYYCFVSRDNFFNYSTYFLTILTNFLKIKMMVWVKPWLQRRSSKSVYRNLVLELKLPERYVC